MHGSAQNATKINPFTAPAYKIYGLKEACKQYISLSYNTSALSAKHFDKNTHASGKQKTKRLKGFKFRSFVGRFPRDILAVKGLMILCVEKFVPRSITLPCADSGLEWRLCLFAPGGVVRGGRRPRHIF